MDEVQAVPELLNPSVVLARLIRKHLLGKDGVTRIPAARRFTVLYSTNNPADSVFIPESGLVKIVKRGPDHKEVLLTLIGPGEVFGEEALLLGGDRQASAEIVQEATISIVPRELFARFCNDNPESWRLLAEILSRRQRDLQHKIELLLMRDVQQRILLYLAELAEIVGVHDENGGGARSVRLSQGEVASLVGATRETTSTALNELARRGLVSLGRRKLTVANSNALREAAEGR